MNKELDDGLMSFVVIDRTNGQRIWTDNIDAFCGKACYIHTRKGWYARIAETKADIDHIRNIISEMAQILAENGVNGEPNGVMHQKGIRNLMMLSLHVLKARNLKNRCFFSK